MAALPLRILLIATMLTVPTWSAAAVEDNRRGGTDATVSTSYKDLPLIVNATPPIAGPAIISVEAAILTNSSPTGKASEGLDSPHVYDSVVSLVAESVGPYRVRLDADATIVDAESANMRFIWPDGLLPRSLTNFDLAIPTGQAEATFVSRNAEFEALPGEHRVTVRLEAGEHVSFATTFFTIDTLGNSSPGHRAPEDGGRVLGTAPPLADGVGTNTCSVTAQFITPNWATTSTPDIYKGVPLQGMYVELHRPDTGFVGFDYTNPEGRISIPASCEDQYWYFRIVLKGPHLHAGAVQPLISAAPLNSDTPYTFTIQAPAGFGNSYLLAPNDNYAAAAMALSRANQALDKHNAAVFADARGQTVNDRVIIHWSHGLKDEDCRSSCFIHNGDAETSADAAHDILIDGSEGLQEGQYSPGSDSWEPFVILHEYGHLVHDSITGTLDFASSASYGLHCWDAEEGEFKSCHSWTSMHSTEATATKEGFANFFAAFAFGGSQIPWRTWDIENVLGSYQDGTEVNRRCQGSPFRDCSQSGILYDLHQRGGVGYGRVVEAVGDVTPSSGSIGRTTQLLLAHGAPTSIRTDFNSSGLIYMGDAESWTDAGPNTGPLGTTMSVATGKAYRGQVAMDVHDQGGGEADSDRSDYYAVTVEYGYRYHVYAKAKDRVFIEALQYNAPLIDRTTVNTIESVFDIDAHNGEWPLRLGFLYNNTREGTYDFRIEKGGEILVDSEVTSVNGVQPALVPFSPVLPAVEYELCFEVNGRGPLDRVDVTTIDDIGNQANFSKYPPFRPLGEPECVKVTAPASGSQQVLVSATGPLNTVNTNHTVHIITSPGPGFLWRYPSKVPNQHHGYDDSGLVCWRVTGIGPISKTWLSLQTSQETTTTPEHVGVAPGEFCDFVPLPSTWDGWEYADHITARVHVATLQGVIEGVELEIPTDPTLYLRSRCDDCEDRGLAPAFIREIPYPYPPQAALGGTAFERWNQATPAGWTPTLPCEGVSTGRCEFFIPRPPFGVKLVQADVLTEDSILYKGEIHGVNVASFTPLLPSASVGLGIDVAWTSLARGQELVDEYQVYRVDEGARSLLAALPATNRTFVDATAQVNRAYQYDVIAAGEPGTTDSSMGIPGVFSGNPSPITDLEVGTGTIGTNGWYISPVSFATVTHDGETNAIDPVLSVQLLRDGQVRGNAQRYVEELEALSGWQAAPARPLAPSPQLSIDPQAKQGSGSIAIALTNDLATQTEGAATVARTIDVDLSGTNVLRLWAKYQTSRLGEWTGKFDVVLSDAGVVRSSQTFVISEGPWRMLEFPLPSNIGPVDRVEIRPFEARKDLAGPEIQTFTIDGMQAVEEQSTMEEQDGIHVWGSNVTTAGHGARPTARSTIRVDTADPWTIANVTGQRGNGSWYHNAVTFALSAVDNTSGVATTYYQINTGSTQQYSGQPITIVASGTLCLKFWSVDQAGNTEGDRTRCVKVDRNAPTSSITLAGSGNGPNYRGDVTVEIRAADTSQESGVGWVYYRIDNGAWSLHTGAASVPLFVVTADGPHKIDSQSVDKAGLPGSTLSKEFVIDRAPPTIGSRSPAPDTMAGPNALVTFDHADAISGVDPAATAFIIERSLVGQSGPWEVVTSHGTTSKTATSTTWQHNSPTGMPAGLYRVTGTVYDKAGNSIAIAPTTEWRFQISVT